MVLAAGELAALQAAAALLLDKTADIQRNSGSTFVLGQPQENWASILGDPPTLVPAGLAGPSQALLQMYSTFIGTQQARIVKFTYGQDVQSQDRVVIDGETYTVHVLLSERSYPTLTRVLATRMVN